jgi:hypothetical protein
MDSFSLDTWYPGTILPFSHDPLDRTKASIRLLRVLPTLLRGFLQCEITNESIHTDFSCLSYTWGESMAEYQILVNEKPFCVRRNLLEFLEVARRNYPLRAFWIDAICIDQTKVEERNHQVAQMGQIYSKAREVIIWLGANKAMAKFFSTWPTYIAAASSKTEGSGSSVISAKAGYLALVDHAYWRRAWVTQEIVLARTLRLLADDVELDAADLAGIANAPYDSRPVMDSRFLSHLDIASGVRKLKGVPLVKLLYNLPNRQCSLPRDQIYSLLSLAAEGTNIAVDYDSEDTDFMFNIVKACEQSMCFCSLGLLAGFCQKWSLDDMQRKGLHSLRRQTHKSYATLANSDFFRHVATQYVDVYMTPCELESPSSVTERPRCIACRTKLPWRTIKGPVFCLLSICSLFRGHIYLKRSIRSGDTIRWKAGSFKETFHLSSDISGTSGYDARWFGMSLQQTSKHFTLRLSILFLLWREWQTHSPSSKRLSQMTADEAPFDLCRKATNRHGCFRVSREM